ncbi:hypothetical protein EBESD8_21720 [Rhodococcus aetherivorans]|nr:hypothetical protein EBESD8_21720 [Rhodococcus aetherivorans]
MESVRCSRRFGCAHGGDRSVRDADAFAACLGCPLSGQLSGL